MADFLQKFNTGSVTHLALILLCGVVWLAACADIRLPLVASDNTSIGDNSLSVTGQPAASERPRLPVAEMVGFTDPTAGFEARVPQRWTRIVQNAPDDAGVTISFESPPSDATDVFADYLMVDIQPGSVVDVLEQQPDERTLMTVAGQRVYRERIVLDNHPVGDTHLDLVAWQLVLQGPGYSIAIYTVGERREQARLERVLIEFAYSFSLPAPPFLLT